MVMSTLGVVGALGFFGFLSGPPLAVAAPHSVATDGVRQQPVAPWPTMPQLPLPGLGESLDPAPYPAADHQQPICVPGSVQCSPPPLEIPQEPQLQIDELPQLPQQQQQQYEEIPQLPQQQQQQYEEIPQLPQQQQQQYEEIPQLPQQQQQQYEEIPQLPQQQQQQYEEIPQLPQQQQQQQQQQYEELPQQQQNGGTVCSPPNPLCTPPEIPPLRTNEGICDPPCTPAREIPDSPSLGPIPSPVVPVPGPIVPVPGAAPVPAVPGVVIPGAAEPIPVQGLELSDPAVAPGALVTASGSGCPPGAGVALSVEGVRAGETQADAAGAFEAPINPVVADVGRHQVSAECGPVLTAPLDIVLVSQATGSTATSVVIVFFLLIGLLLYRRRLLTPQSYRAQPQSDLEEPQPDLGERS
ncbi:hypothetical protein JWS13_01495 (plasmid) [Rhodococcus pseudokoreensis]|uniref:Ig-like domain (Group 3) n=1 Tax=Rhodococcus pseudokoreensis TaxID=2811421 RepID=A0A974ZRF3_9NOCA|nr:hypothetical protein [Rhodococcus pseudokoreensis]QSE87357.1 hypothetical protein JWS13_01495 [Rhodococcus pseudokoreensis]